ncbi:MAG TPA: arsinothricin resistance N-acetyltransferase ArsN1 family A [Thermodesulfobacteriota bacterium]
MSQPTLVIRDASPADIPGIIAIRNQGIEDRHATLDTEPYTVAEGRAWFEAHDARHPVLVAVDAETGAMAGWASLNVFNPRPGYRLVAELSVYVERASRARGVGSQLLEALLARARALEYHKVVLTAMAHNTAGRALYARFGFREVGIFKEQGLVDGRWVDTVIMEKIL